MNIDSLFNAIEITKLKNGEYGKLHPLVLRGQIIPDYYLDECGNPWSLKWNKIRKLAVSIAGKSKYPAISMSNGKQITVDLHRVVAETFHPKPIPAGIPKEVWDKTDDRVKNLVLSELQVNHIDHDPTNYHPSNLEWTTGKENNEKSYKHYHGNKI